jgi:hypothetical protein
MRLTRYRSGVIRTGTITCWCGAVFQVWGDYALQVKTIKTKAGPVCLAHRYVSLDEVPQPPRLEDLVREGALAGA